MAAGPNYRPHRSATSPVLLCCLLGLLGLPRATTGSALSILSPRLVTELEDALAGHCAEDGRASSEDDRPLSMKASFTFEEDTFDLTIARETSSRYLVSVGPRDRAREAWKLRRRYERGKSGTCDCDQVDPDHFLGVKDIFVYDEALRIRLLGEQLDLETECCVDVLQTGGELFLRFDSPEWLEVSRHPRSPDAAKPNLRDHVEQLFDLFEGLRPSSDTDDALDSRELDWFRSRLLEEDFERLGTRKVAGVPAEGFRLSLTLAVTGELLPGLAAPGPGNADLSDEEDPEITNHADFWISTRDCRLSSMRITSTDSEDPGGFPFALEATFHEPKQKIRWPEMSAR